MNEMNRFFHEELDTLKLDLIQMGQHCQEAVRHAVDAIIKSDLELSQKVKKIENDIDELELKIDGEIIRYFSLRSPMVSDIRLLTLAMKACHDLERTGDEAANIAKRAKRIAGREPVSQLFHIEEMTDLALSLFKEAMDSFIMEDLTLAQSIASKDKEIDRLNKENYKLFTNLIATEPQHAKSAVEFLFISKSLERVADHAVNIASEVIFLLSAEDIRHSSQTARK